jgi:hypothetical protein
VDGEITGPARSIAVRLILDTGATTSLINKRVLTAIGFDPDGGAGQAGQVELTTGSKVEKATRVMLTRLTARGQHRFGFTVVAHDLPATTTADGLLGLDFFRDTALTLDFRKGVIVLS